MLGLGAGAAAKSPSSSAVSASATGTRCHRTLLLAFAAGLVLASASASSLMHVASCPGSAEFSREQRRAEGGIRGTVEEKGAAEAAFGSDGRASKSSSCMAMSLSGHGATGGAGLTPIALGVAPTSVSDATGDGAASNEGLLSLLDRRPAKSRSPAKSEVASGHAD